MEVCQGSQSHCHCTADFTVSLPCTVFVFDCCPFSYVKTSSSTRPEVHDASHRRHSSQYDRATATGNTYRKLQEIWTRGFLIHVSGYTDRDRRITILCTAMGGKVKMLQSTDLNKSRNMSKSVFIPGVFGGILPRKIMFPKIFDATQWCSLYRKFQAWEKAMRGVSVCMTTWQLFTSPKASWIRGYISSSEGSKSVFGRGSARTPLWKLTTLAQPPVGRRGDTHLHNASPICQKSPKAKASWINTDQADQVY